MQFEIQVDINARRFKMQVERIYAGESMEKFKVAGGNRFIVLQSNRPFLVATKSKSKVQ